METFEYLLLFLFAHKQSECCQYFRAPRSKKRAEERRKEAEAEAERKAQKKKEREERLKIDELRKE